MTRSFKEGEGLAPVRVEASTANPAKVLDGLHAPTHDEEDDLKALQDKVAEDGVESPRSAHGQGGFRFDTPEHKAQLAAQRQQLWQWLKGVGQHMFREGINLTKISLPVCLFEARSFLERMTTNWEYQDLLTAASRATDPADRMRYIVAFAVSGLSRQVSFHKPFNPILGETYQAQYPNGVQVYCEQISHHPPVSSWQVYEPNGQYVFHGSSNWSAGIKGNSVKGRQTGINCVEFADGSKITYELPGLQVKGVLWGDRVLKYSGEMVFKDEKNDLIAEIQIDFHPHSSGFLHLGSWFSRKKAVPYKPDQVTGTLKHAGQVVDTANGNWLHYFEWEKGAAGGTLKRLWDIKLSKLTPAVPVESPLESDCRNRLDVVHLRAGDQAKAQEWKLKLEEAQRRDRKVRKDGGGYAEH